MGCDMTGSKGESEGSKALPPYCPPSKGEDHSNMINLIQSQSCSLLLFGIGFLNNG